jgi:phage tail sheath gpL-like
MAISFASVPFGVKVPGVYAEFDTSKAQQGPSIQNYVGLIIGQRLSTGSKAAGTIERITSESQARDFYGKGSMLFHQVKAWLDANKINELNVYAFDDDGGGVAAAGSIEALTAATAAGTIHLMIGGRQYNVAVASGDTETTIITAIKTAIDADEDRHVTTGVIAADVLPITYRHAGEVGNDIDIRFNHFFGEELPAGVTFTVVAMSSGAGNPALTAAIAEMGETQFHSITMPYSDASNLLLMQTEMQDRWGAIRQNDGQVYIARKETFGLHATFLGTRNNEQETVMNIAGPTPSFSWAANIAAQVSSNAQQDPARPFQTLSLTSVIAPKDSEQFTFAERNLILVDGGSTYFVDASGVARIERLRTTRIENSFAAPDESLADLNPKLTLSYLRFDFRTMMLTKFPRHKLANDGTRFGAGQAIITPLIGKAEAVAKFRSWEELGLAEGAEQFKRDLIVERNASDPNRLDFLLPPDLVNQLRVSGVAFQFLL